MKDIDAISNDCRRATLLLEKFQLTEPEPSELEELTIHLEGCSTCRLYGEQSRLINQLLQQLTTRYRNTDITLDPGVKKSMQELINKKIR